MKLPHIHDDVAEQLAREGNGPVEAIAESAVAEAITVVHDYSLTSSNTVDQANLKLARGAAAESAVRVVMEQLGLKHPTRVTKWTMWEIERLLDVLYDEPEGEIKLGGQTLGKGFTSASKPKA